MDTRFPKRKCLPHPKNAPTVAPAHQRICQNLNGKKGQIGQARQKQPKVSLLHHQTSQNHPL